MVVELPVVFIPYSHQYIDTIFVSCTRWRKNSKKSSQIRSSLFFGKKFGRDGRNLWFSLPLGVTFGTSHELIISNWAYGAWCFYYVLNGVCTVWWTFCRLTKQLNSLLFWPFVAPILFGEQFELLKLQHATPGPPVYSSTWHGPQGTRNTRAWMLFIQVAQSYDLVVGTLFFPPVTYHLLSKFGMWVELVCDCVLEVTFWQKRHTCDVPCAVHVKIMSGLWVYMYKRKFFFSNFGLGGACMNLHRIWKMRTFGLSREIFRFFQCTYVSGRKRWAWRDTTPQTSQRSRLFVGHQQTMLILRNMNIYIYTHAVYLYICAHRQFP